MAGSMEAKCRMRLRRGAIDRAQSSGAMNCAASACVEQRNPLALAFVKLQVFTELYTTAIFDPTSA
jgi:hypothetical protein